MYLHDGAIRRDTVIKSFGSVKKFFDYLTRARNLIADVYIDNILTISSLVTFSIDSGYLMANIDARFGMKELVSFKDITITVRAANSEAILIESHTSGLSEAIPANDVDADLWFRIGSIYPFNELKYDVPPSRFNSMRTANMSQIDFKALSSIESGESGESESGESGEGGGSGESGSGSSGSEETTYSISWVASENFIIVYNGDDPDLADLEYVPSGKEFTFEVQGINGMAVASVFIGENELIPSGSTYSVVVNNNITIIVNTRPEISVDPTPELSNLTMDDNGSSLTFSVTCNNQLDRQLNWVVRLGSDASGEIFDEQSTDGTTLVYTGENYSLLQGYGVYVTVSCSEAIISSDFQVSSGLEEP